MPAVGDLGAVAAKECIEHVLGVDVELLDERRQPGLPDLLYQQEGQTVIVEVKQIVDSNYMSLSKASSARGYTRDARLTRLWTVWYGQGSICSRETVQDLVRQQHGADGEAPAWLLPHVSSLGRLRPGDVQSG
jgi:hypothetical protein